MGKLLYSVIELLSIVFAVRWKISIPPPKAHPLQQTGQGLTAWGQLPLVSNAGEGLPHVCTGDSISSLGNRPTTNTTPLIGIWEAHFAYCRLVLPAERHVHFSLHVAPNRLEPPVESLSPAAFHHGIIRHSRRGCDPGEGTYIPTYIARRSKFVWLVGSVPSYYGTLTCLSCLLQPDLRCSPAHHPRDSQRFPPSRPPQGHGR